MIGFCFGLPTITYIITGPFLLQKLTAHFEKRTTIHFGLLFMTISLLVIGPSYILHLPKQVWITIVGFAIIGMGAASSVVPIIPEMLDAVDGKYSDEAQVKDVAASIFNMANGVG